MNGTAAGIETMPTAVRIAYRAIGDQTIRGLKGASNEIPCTASMVVVFAETPFGEPQKIIVADPNTAVTHVGKSFTRRNVVSFAPREKVSVPQIDPLLW